MDQAIPLDPGLLIAQNADTDTQKILTKINEKAGQLKASGLAREDQDILRNGRLSFIWCETDENTVSVTIWRRARARRAYGKIQDASDHLFLAVALALTPTECSRTGFDRVLDCISGVENFEPYRLNLDFMAKRFFEGIAAQQGFAMNHRYLTFMQTLFPQRS